MIERGYGAGFAFEAFGELLFGDFDGDRAVETRVAGAIHLAHASGAEQPEDLVWSEARSRSQRHRLSDDCIVSGRGNDAEFGGGAAQELLANLDGVCADRLREAARLSFQVTSGRRVRHGSKGSGPERIGCFAGRRSPATFRYEGFTAVIGKCLPAVDPDATSGLQSSPPRGSCSRVACFVHNPHLISLPFPAHPLGIRSSLSALR